MFLSGLLLSLAQAEPLDSAATKTLVEKIAAIRQSRPFIQASYREEKSGGILARPSISTGKMWYAAPDKFRKESRGAGKESVIVSNGELLWMYYPAFQEAERYDLKKQKFISQGISAFTTGLDFAQVDKDFTIQAEALPSGYSIQLVPKRGAISRMVTQLEVRFNKGLELESVQTVSPRGEKIKTELTDLSTEPVPAATFDFTPPAGANVSTPLGK
ncbi:MAG: outer membrane lipoprotein carrier protein LolA [Chthoniobacterales bacterium]